MSTAAEALYARRARLGMPTSRIPVVTAPIPKPALPKRPKDILKLQSDPPKPVPPAPRAVPPRQHLIESEIVPLHRIAAERWKDVLRETAEKHRMSVTTLLSKRRAREIVSARQEACYRLVMEFGMSYPAVARRVNYFDHTSVIHAVRKHAERHGLTVDVRQEICEDMKLRDAAIARGFQIGRTVRELSDQFDLSTERIRNILRERAAEAAGAQ
jgi:hypothetical protein